jgi:hypothetical protein
MGVRALMTSFFPWIQAGVKELDDAVKRRRDHV